MQSWESVKKELLKNKKVLAEYNRLEPEYAIISQIIEARIKKGMTQKRLAQKIKTKQSAIARLESGSFNPTYKFLQGLASALGKRLEIKFV